MENKDPHYVGHRQRLKQKLLESTAGLADYELVEILLFSAIPRRDVKPLAKKLLEHFGNLYNLINADKEKLLLVDGINENICSSLYLIKEMIRRILKHKIIKQNVISSWGALLDYLKSTMSGLKVEQFRILFLNKKNVLIAEEIIGVGTIDQAPVYPREIVKRALFHEAGAIILVHNHPSGSSKPSKADITLTDTIVETCNSVSISVHDHVIIAGNDYYSFKSNMLL
jgi:DNA repair protein RadC